jgi:hypothetical protein
MPARIDLERLVEWGDTDPPFEWLKPVVGAALGVHPIISIGEEQPPAAAALCVGDVRLSRTPAISELPAERAHFAGTLVGVRNPGRELQLALDATESGILAKVTGSGLPVPWGSGLTVQHVTDETGLISLDWTLPADGTTGQDHDLLFELLLWPALKKGVTLTGPP